MPTTDTCPPEWIAHYRTWTDEIRARVHEPGALWAYIQTMGPKRVRHLGNGEILMSSPLRDDGKTSSFRVHDHTSTWKDFGGCQEGGDWFHFVALLKGWSIARDWPKFLAHACEFYGLPTWEERKAQIRGVTPNAAALEPLDEATILEKWNGTYIEEATVFGAMTWLAGLAHALLLPHPAHAHLVGHYGFDPDFLASQLVGFCPPNFWHEAVSPERECPYTPRQLLATGWFHEKRTPDLRSADAWGLSLPDTLLGAVKPAFADRIVWPYWRSGLVQYAIGRQWFGPATKADLAAWYEANPWDAGKYKKLPLRSDARPYISPHISNTVIWNEDCLKRARGQWVWVTEGVADAFSLAQHGILVISPVTIAFSDHDIERVIALLLRAGVAGVRICNDNDVTIDKKTGKERRPGLEGAKKIASALWTAGIDVRVVTLPKPEGVAKIDLNEWIVAQQRELADVV
jgi:hypothetical protein